MRVKSLLALLFLSSTVFAYQTTYNPFTGKLDYVGVSSGSIPAGSNNYIQNTSSLQSGATFYVSSGTVNGPFWSNTQFGSGLSACGDSTHALAWSAGTYSCQAITGTGGGGSPSGSINAGSQHGAAYYSVSGSSNVVDSSTHFKIYPSSSAETGVLGSSVTYSVTAGSVTVGDLSISLPVQTDANKKLISTAIDLSGSQATGTMAAARMPALTGDITTTAGALATTAAVNQGNIKVFTSSVTFVNVLGLNTTFGIVASSISVSSANVGGQLTAGAVTIQGTNVITQFVAIGLASTTANTQLLAIETDTTSIVTNSIARFNAVDVSTKNIASSTAAIANLLNGKVNYSSFSVTAPLIYNNGTGASSFSQQVAQHETFTSSVTISGAVQAATATFTQGGSPSPYTNAPLQVYGNTNGFIQTVVQNTSSGPLASGDIVITSDLGGNTSYYLDIGINSSKNADPSYPVLWSTSSYVYSSDADLVIGAGWNATDPNAMIMFVTSAPIAANTRMTIYSSGSIQTYGNLSISSGMILNGSAGTSGQVVTSGGPGAIPSWTTASGSGGGSSGTIVQVIQVTTTTAASTTNTAFTNTNLSATITPLAASDQIKITVIGTLSNASAAAAAYATIAKGTANLLATNGQCSESGLASGVVSCAMGFIDVGPLTLSPTTYFVQAMTSNGAFATTFGGTNLTQTIILEEFSPSGGVSGVALLKSTQTWTGQNNWTGPQKSTFTALEVTNLTINNSQTVVSTSSVDTLTNKTIDAEGAGNSITIPFIVNYRAGLCQAGTASLGFSNYTSSGPTATCLLSSSTVIGAAAFVDGSTNTVQDHFRLPSDWTGNIDLQAVWTSTMTNNQVFWEMRTACISSGTFSAQTFNAYQNVFSGAPSFAGDFTEASQSALTVTGCTANSQFFFEFARNGSHPTLDTHLGNANLIDLMFTMRRAL